MTLEDYEGEGQLEELHIIQSVGGNWSIRNKDGEEVEGPFRRCADAQEWINREGHLVGNIQAWNSDK